ncbi:MAG: hypothetical protein FWD11_09560 [Micrococcales bacterium]|nr:hypothetical protein [Micrococcales bacterium]
MRKKVVTVGSSAGITISPAELRALGLSVGDPVEVSVRGGVLEVSKVSPFAGLSLDELLALVDERTGR